MKPRDAWLLALNLFVLFSLTFGIACDDDDDSANDSGEEDDDSSTGDDDTSPSGDDDSSADDDDSSFCRECFDENLLLSVEVEDAPDENPLARKIIVETRTACSLAGYVQIEGEPGYGPSDPEASATSTYHEFNFYGLLENQTVRYVFYRNDEEAKIVAKGCFITPTPVGKPAIASLTFTPTAAGDDWYMIEYIDKTEYLRQQLLYDRQGRLRFYHPADKAGKFTQVLNNGDLYSSSSNKLIGTRLDGAEYVLFPVNLNDPVMRHTHHKPYVASAAAERAWVVFARYGSGLECDRETPTEMAVGDGVAEIDQEGNELWRFDYFDHTDELPPEDLDPVLCLMQYWGPEASDMTHGNAVTPADEEGMLLLSYRNMNRVIKIDRATGEIVWQMGAGLDFTWLGDEPEQEKWFYRQHDPYWLGNGRLLVYDNNKDLGWSRALELQVDQENMTVQQLWEYRLPHNTANGNAERNANGNTLICNGTGGTVIEVPAGGGAGDELFVLTYMEGTARALYYPALWIDQAPPVK